jgi:hypothetical protein
MIIAAGHPAVAYYDTQLRRVMYTRALDPLGAAWGSPRAIAAWTHGELSMTLVDGRPAIRYNDVLTGEETFISANDAEGSSWSFPMAIDPIAAAGDTVGLESIRITSIAGAPALAYTSAHTVGVQILSYVRYVSYY